MNKRLFLIDGTFFCYRAYYAIRTLMNSKGQPTNAVYGFIAMLNKLIKEQNPDYLGVAFDLRGPTFRHKKFEAYKITRKPMPDDLVSQIPLIKETLGAYNIPIFEQQGYEADDILATLAKEASSKVIDTFIVTGDKDALQLIGPHIKVYNTHKEGLVLDAEAVKEQFKVGPEQITDLMALMGDASDNIPGVTGIGEKTAIQLIAEFGSLESLFNNLDKIKSEAKRELLKKYKNQAEMSKELALLDCKVPIEVKFEDLKMQEPDREKLTTLFRDLEFKTLLDQVIERKELDASYRLIKGEKAFKDFLKRLSSQDLFAFDFETTSSDPIQASLVGVSFCWEEGKADYIDFRTQGLNTEYVLGKIKPILEDETVKKIGQNIKYEKLVLANHGIDLRGIYFDTMVASYLLNQSKLTHNLSSIALEYLNHKMTDISELIGKGKKQITMDQVDIDRVCSYCCEDSDVTLRLKEILEKRLREKGLLELFSDVEIPLIDVLARMEFLGVSLDVGYMEEISKKTQKKLEALTKDIYEMAGCEFNINSPKQLQDILFVKLKLPVIKRTKTGMSTDEEVLWKLAGKHSLPKALLEYRGLAKLKSTYMDALPKLINTKTKRIHTSFNQTVTSTGRLSSSEPNLQNIPVRTEIGRQIRKAFIPKDKKSVILSADYSQIELRILAHLSGDEVLREALQGDLDVHSHTASLIFDVPQDHVTDQQRSQAKTVNFGIVYGMSAYGLSKDLGIEVEKAQKFIDSYFERYPKVREFIYKCIGGAREEGFVTTLLNRRRYIPEINSENINIRNFAERTAINTPIQGSAADLIKLAMIDIHKELESGKLYSAMILQVHDELVFDVPKDELKTITDLVKKKMEGIMALSVPIKVNISVGKNWLELEEIAS
ncbi:MAG: DNA polymerase I [Candidatus Omnitrophica bacterium]|nr:DNA polymerase I [Candidatus Omnitrophota bacterium]